MGTKKQGKNEGKIWGDFRSEIYPQKQGEKGGEIRAIFLRFLEVQKKYLRSPLKKKAQFVVTKSAVC